MRYLRLKTWCITRHQQVVDIVRVMLYANKSVWHLIMHYVVAPTFKFYAVATKIMRF
jgi:hypothetical protein